MDYSIGTVRLDLKELLAEAKRKVLVDLGLLIHRDKGKDGLDGDRESSTKELLDLFLVLLSDFRQ